MIYATYKNNIDFILIHTITCTLLFATFLMSLDRLDLELVQISQLYGATVQKRAPR